MSCRPVDQIAASRDAEGRQVIWEAIRSQNGAEFRVQDLTETIWVNRSTIRSYVTCLTAGGILECRDTDDGFRWRLVLDEGHYAPRLTRGGQRVTQGLGTEQMWRAMRVMKQFDVRELALHASTDDVQVAEESARKYIQMLLATGYLTCIQKATHEKRAAYRLTRNSGPLAPQIQRVKQVFDPNSKTVFRKGDA